MTNQYQEEDINGQPSALSLRLVPTAPPVPVVGPNDASLFLPTAVADAVITGSGIAIGGDATTGNLYQISQPGLFRVSFTVADSGLTGSPINILRGAIVGTIGGILYPAVDFVGAPAPGIVGLGNTSSPGDVLGSTTMVEAFVRITNADLVDPVGGVNPNRQIIIAVFPPIILGLIPATAIQITIDRVSL